MICIILIYLKAKRDTNNTIKRQYRYTSYIIKFDHAGVSLHHGIVVYFNIKLENAYIIDSRGKATSDSLPGRLDSWFEWDMLHH
jgi:hypothetical protein